MKNNYFLTIILLWASGLVGQSNTVSAGGNATGPNGSSSFSVGQVVYEYTDTASFSVSEGVQQPFEITPLSAPQFTEGSLQVTFYPNPTTSGFYISISDADYAKAEFTLFTINGKIIKEGKISEGETFVITDRINAGVYLLRINNGKGAISSYKIIKR